jgi:beta-carotene hydroxylase
MPPLLAEDRAASIDASRIRGRGVAWPTIILAAVAALSWWAAILGHILGMLGTSSAALVAFVAAYASLTPAHEAAHGNVSGRAHPWLDVLVGQVSLFCLLGPFLPFRTVHLRHHAHTNDPERDPDMWMAAPAPLLPLRAATILQYYWWCYWCPPPGVRAEHHHRRYAVVFFSLLGVAFATLIASGHAATVLVVVVAPAWLALAVLAVVFTLLPHHPHIRGDRFLNSRARPGWWRTTLTLGQNYHLVHHLWPTVPWYRYGAVYRTNWRGLQARGSDVGQGEAHSVRHPRARRSTARQDGSR